LVKRLLVIGFLATLCLPLLASEDDDASLRGLNAFKVVVENLNADSIQAGLNLQDIQTAVELRCRVAGVPISPTSSGYYLYVNITSVQRHYLSGEPTGDYAIAMFLEFRQGVRLSRDPTNLCIAGTWKTMTVLTMSRKDVVSVCRDTLNGLVDEFLNAYLAQNPKIRN
jgi:hypothetical protein